MSLFNQLILTKKYSEANLLITVGFKNTGSIWIQLIRNVLIAYNSNSVPQESHVLFKNLTARPDFIDDSLSITTPINELYITKGITIKDISTSKTPEMLIVDIMTKLIQKYNKKPQ